ncbi:hypothetical protein [Sphingomonas mollis]|uniref:hypothetical protein n=1 Tax=Sphingomonas mollis TaxID=2795726 RepID=UPI001E316CEF|nr:hypothetical protein [Sphingomonas sp. BT553]
MERDPHALCQCHQSWIAMRVDQTRRLDGKDTAMIVGWNRCWCEKGNTHAIV